MAADRPTVDIELETLIRARYPIIYIVSWEERRVEETLREICQRRGKKMLLWTYTTGMAGNVASRDPLAALDYIMNAPDQSVFVLKDFHPFISDVAVTRRLRDLIYILKTSYKTLIVLSPLLKLPPELEKEVTVVDYQLPTQRDLDRLLEGIIQSVKANPQVKTDLSALERDQVLKAASGLTSNEAENVFAKSLVEKRSFDVDVILSEKEQIIRKSGILEYYRASEAFSNVGGLDLLKDWMGQRTASFSEEARKYGLPEPRGILLLGVQGCGKSLTAKAIASLWRLPLLRLDVGKVFAGIVGSSEENMRKAITTAESVAPCVSGDTRITLADGSERTIESLYDGADDTLSVLSMNEQFRIAPTHVKAITRREAPDLYHIRLRHSELKATSNHLHPVLRDGKMIWVRTDELALKDSIAVPRRIPLATEAPRSIAFLPAETRIYFDGALSYARPECVTPQRRYAARQRGSDFVRVNEIADMNCFCDLTLVRQFSKGHSGTAQSVLPKLPNVIHAEIGYLLGLIDSDGFIGKNGRVGFVNTDRSLHGIFGSLLCREFGLEIKTRWTMNQSASALVGTDADSVFRPCGVSYVDNRILASFLSRLRASLLTLPVTVLQAYVRGLFDGDGSVTDTTQASPRITVTAKKPELNRMVRAILQRIGFVSTNPGDANITITGMRNVQRFASEIGSRHPCRQARMQRWLETDPLIDEKDRTDGIPVGDLLRQARQEIGMPSNAFASAPSSAIHRWETSKANPSRTRLNDLLQEMMTWAEKNSRTTLHLTEIQKLVEADVLWSPVLCVKQVDTPHWVYDLVCDEPHNFLANGIVTHNCILWLDELEKGFAGTQSSGMSDGGTTSRVFSTFLTWLSDKTSPCFVVATSNDVSQLPPEMMRKGRFDEIFFVDLPAIPERREIFAIHLKKRNRDPQKFDLDALAAASVGFSGAEIEQTVIEALFNAFHENHRELGTDDILKSVRATVPLSVTMSENIEELRRWAETRARATSSQPAETMEEIIQTEFAERNDSQTRQVFAAVPPNLPPVEMPPALPAAVDPPFNRSPFAMELPDSEPSDEEEITDETESSEG